MENLHFLPNNILTNFFKELTKYKNDYISIIFKLYIYRNYTMHLNIYIYIYIYFKYIPTYARGYKLVLLMQDQFSVIIYFKIISMVEID